MTDNEDDGEVTIGVIEITTDELDAAIAEDREETLSLIDAGEFVADEWKLVEEAYSDRFPPELMTIIKNVFYGASEHLFDGVTANLRGAMGSDDPEAARNKLIERMRSIENELYAHHITVCPSCKARAEAGEDMTVAGTRH